MTCYLSSISEIYSTPIEINPGREINMNGPKWWPHTNIIWSDSFKTIVVHFVWSIEIWKLQPQVLVEHFENYDLDLVRLINPRSKKKMYTVIWTYYVTKLVEDKALPKCIFKINFKKMYSYKLSYQDCARIVHKKDKECFDHWTWSSFLYSPIESCELEISTITIAYN